VDEPGRVIVKKQAAGMPKSQVIIKTKGKSLQGSLLFIITRVGVKSTAIDRHHVMPINRISGSRFQGRNQ